MSKVHSSGLSLLLIFGAPIISLGLGAKPGLAITTYYVATNGSDSNSGTQSSPFATITYAAYKAKPGDTVYVRGGTYSFTKEQYIGSIGTSSNPIRYQSYPGEKAILDGSKTPSNTNIVNLAGAYNIFKGFEVKNSKFTGIVSWGGNNLQILNNTIYNSYRNGIFVGYDKDMTTASNIRIDGNTVYLNCLANKSRTLSGGWDQGIASGRASNITISNNHVYQNYGEGIDFILTKGGVASKNKVHDNYSVNLYLDNATDITVERNHIYTTNNTNFYRDGKPASGIQAANEYYDFSNPVNNIKIRNNIVTGGNTGFAYFSTYGRGGGLKNFVIANNTFYKATRAILLIHSDPGHTNNLIANNIFYQTGSVAMTEIPAKTGLAFRNNGWYGGSAGIAVGTGDITSNPLLVNPGTTVATDYKLKLGSLAIETGTTLTQVTNDYAGSSRPLGLKHDIGAYEFFK
ncbi:right-handed parallel beta-helix repeat-containing protein [Coleofasciculus sp. FACHB-1120]|uniref:right-handed parallel beta-helix repeat-containing protein n=1 Tax=Coleofasciculus sp. FACHB-1120 TaxID=2692783 RepID=UPI00168A054C|nr:right-handed parallel beta-helix repeat-containing protein [Coleofasciculus sp. FACHB-1120]MBD2744797.1 right-handed parallel beta-helix repeat-containing protein [Coleofasciculus sp. FACHB-1120]